MRLFEMLLRHGWAPRGARTLVRQHVTSATAAPGSWQVSSHGRVCTSLGAISFGSVTPAGYRKAAVYGETILVHRMVALAFLGPPPTEDAWQVNHKDGNRENNGISNLEYVTCAQNHRHSRASNTRRCSGHMHSKPVRYRASGSTDWRRCPSVKLAALELGVSCSAVSAACQNQRPLKSYEVSFLDLEEPQLPGEVWKPMLCPLSHKAVPGRAISSLGRLRMRTGLIQTGYLSRDGYCYTGYTSAGFGSRVETVHTLVARAFLRSRPSPLHIHVNHKDGDKKNNAAANLEYVTPAENMAHYWKNRSAQHERPCRSVSKPVWSRAYDSKDQWTWHPSQTSAAKMRGVHQSSISACIRGKYRQGGGYEFQAAGAFQSLPGEEWREVDAQALMEEKRKRIRARLRPAHVVSHT